VTGLPDTARRRPQVKICGLTRPDEAARCAERGADAIGLVFFPKSPRHVSRAQARAVVAALPAAVAAVGVFVDETYAAIMSRVDGCGLSMVQLHGRESPHLAARLRSAGVGVIKALFVGGRPGLDDAAGFDVDGILVECARGPLPGGNALTWDWKAASDLGRRYPLVLAGGLRADNLAEAIAAARPAAIDLSSGVEAAPGRKDDRKVSQLMAALGAAVRPDDGDPLPVVFAARESLHHAR
jgi:phosphoribosylanthranilate isomerase